VVDNDSLDKMTRSETTKRKPDAHGGRDPHDAHGVTRAARAAYALIRAGYIDMPRTFFRFCADVITDEGSVVRNQA
jgi:hypothetical protein